MRRDWCDSCRGAADGDEDLKKCSKCPRKFHIECCAGLKGAGADWACPHCVAEAEEPQDPTASLAAKAREKLVRAAHGELKARACVFFERERACLAPFVPAIRLKEMCGSKAARRHSEGVPPIRPNEPFIQAKLRPYQVAGVNWIISQYNQGTGGILADEMGLGKTLQTLSFLSALKAAGLPGPHLVVTPLAVLQNWANEMKRFTPELSFIKLHGSQGERDRLLGMDKVLSGAYDVYITTYETVLSEEAFFTESFLFHTITIDEGHRLKNESSKLCGSLSRIVTPFRLLLTGTPLQNNLNELWALMHYILPDVLDGCKATFEEACNADEGHLDTSVVTSARSLLESLMIRRVKAEVEASLRPKVQYVLKVPLSTLQRQWYKRFLEPKDGETEGLVTRQQIVAKMMQLQKVINHPKCVLLTIEREREAARDLVRRAEGSEYIKTPEVLAPPSAAAQVMEDELRALHGTGLIQSSGKLHLLDRLLFRVRAQGSRVLLFSQYTLTLDVLTEYCAVRFGPEGRGFLRLDGSTNRIKREMDVRMFNAEGSRIPIYLISTRAGGQGINLATADVVVLYDTCWNPQVDLQAQDRAHRIGQKKQVKIFRLIAESTMEERVLTRARQKLVLDALVIKKDGEAGLDMRAGTDDAGDGTDETELSKLSLDELWSFLSHGADQVQQDLEKQTPPLTDKELDSIIATGRAVESETAALDLSDELEAQKFLKSSGGAAAAVPAGDDGTATAAAVGGSVDMTVSTDEEEDPEEERKRKKKKKAGKQYVEVASKFAVGWDGGLALLLDEVGKTKPPYHRETVVVKAVLDGRKYTVEKEGVTEVDDDDEEYGDGGADEHDAAEIASPKQRTRRSSRGQPPASSELKKTRGGVDTTVQPPKKKSRRGEQKIKDASPSPQQQSELKASSAVVQAKQESNDGALEMMPELTAEEQQRLQELEAEAEANAAAAMAASKKQAEAQAMINAVAAAAKGTNSSSSREREDAGNGRRRRTKAPPKRYEDVSLLKTSTRAKRIKLCHDEQCFSCQDGGELLQCSVCPRVYHPTSACAALPQDGAIPSGVWHCPWHSCWECDRKSSVAGGMLFHCMYCPSTWCFDCAPERYTTQRTGTTAHKNLAADLERRGLAGVKNYLFFECDDCERVRGQARRKKAEAKAIRDCNMALAQLEVRVAAIQAMLSDENSRFRLEPSEVEPANAAIAACKDWFLVNVHGQEEVVAPAAPAEPAAPASAGTVALPEDSAVKAESGEKPPTPTPTGRLIKGVEALPTIEEQRQLLERGCAAVTSKLLARQQMEAYVSQLREHTDDQKLRDRIAEVEEQTKTSIREALAKELSDATAWLSATPTATADTISKKQQELSKVCGTILSTIYPSMPTTGLGFGGLTGGDGTCKACMGAHRSHTCGRPPASSGSGRNRSGSGGNAKARAVVEPVVHSSENPVALQQQASLHHAYAAVDDGGGGLVATWSDLVKQCAIAAGRNPNNLKCYLGPATLRRQLEHIGEPDAKEMLQIAQKLELTPEDRVRAGELCTTARDKMPKNDLGGRAAFSAIRSVFGPGAKNTIAPRMRVAATPSASSAPAVPKPAPKPAGPPAAVQKVVQKMVDKVVQSFEPKKTSIHRGVHWCKSARKWKAEIRSGGKRRTLGCFEDENDAAAAYAAAALELGRKPPAQKKQKAAELSAQPAAATNAPAALAGPPTAGSVAKPTDTTAQAAPAPVVADGRGTGSNSLYWRGKVGMSPPAAEKAAAAAPPAALGDGWRDDMSIDEMREWHRRQEQIRQFKIGTGEMRPDNKIHGMQHGLKNTGPIPGFHKTGVTLSRAANEPAAMGGAGPPIASQPVPARGMAALDEVVLPLTAAAASSSSSSSSSSSRRTKGANAAANAGAGRTDPAMICGAQVKAAAVHDRLANIFAKTTAVTQTPLD